MYREKPSTNRKSLTTLHAISDKRAVRGQSPSIITCKLFPQTKEIRRGLVATMPGWHEVGWPVCCINVWRCGGLSMAVLQLKDSLESFVKRMQHLPGSGFLSRCNMT